MNTNINLADAALQRAYHLWQAPLQQGQAFWQASDFAAAETALNEAVRISASFHPLFHFFESGLNTELALTLYAMGDKERLAPVVKRALFQDHFNPAMLSLQSWLNDGAEPTLHPYDIWGLSSPLFDAGESALKAAFLASLSLQGEEKVNSLRAIIRECETNHGAFHRFSAEPYAVRAEFFLAKNELYLAGNDVVKGLNLAPQWHRLLELRKTIEEAQKKA